jgi:nitroimidazol reductase NimA-like FMN-containing flavoprotein (pyridoxamine 5'-phosphate oxidase superfamily)
MRDMTKEEIMEFIKTWTWGTLIGVEKDKPYAVELSYGTDGKYIYCGSKPGGRIARCIMDNPNAVFKICECGWDYASYKAVIVEGKAERLTKHEDILLSVRSIAKQRKLNEHAFDNIAQHVADSPESNSIRIEIKNIGGVMA